MKTNVLLIESNAIYANTILSLFVEGGDEFRVHWVRLLEEALEILMEEPFDVIITNLILGDAGGVDLLSRLHGPTPILCVTEGINRDTAQMVISHGAQDYLDRKELSAALLKKSCFYSIERAKLRAQIAELTVRDALTGLYNRRGFDVFAEQQLKISRRTKRPVTLLYVDLDNLKAINDDISHLAGDEAIIEVACMLKEALRATDVIARVGGDEFIVLAPDTSNGAVGRAIDRLKQKIKVRNTSWAKYQLSASIGAATYDGEGDYDLDGLIAQAEALMYEEKRGKKSHGQSSDQGEGAD